MVELKDSGKSPYVKNTEQPALNIPGVLSQGEVLGNPLADIKDLGKESSKQENTILWANQILEQYNGLSKQTGKEKKKAKSLVSEAARQLLQDPEKVDTAGSVWKSHEPVSQEGSVKHQSFYELVKEESSHQAKDHWKEITSEKLTQFVRTYAYSRLAQDMAEEIIGGYFKGPTGVKQRVDSMYKFVYGLIDLAMDQHALTKALQIARFESPILERESTFNMDIEQASYTVDDDQILGKTISINTTIFSLSRLIPVYDETNIKSFLKNPNSEKRDQRMKSQVERAIKKFNQNREVVLDRLRKLHVLYSSGAIRVSKEYKREWPFTLVLADSDPLRKKFAEQISPLEFSAHIKNEMSEIIKNNIGKNPIFVTVPTQDGFVMTIAMPDYLSQDQRSEVIKTMLKNLRVSEVDKEELMNPDIPVITDIVSYDGIEIPVLRRRISIVDRNKHVLSALEAIGFPIPDLEDKGLGTTNQELSGDIQKQQIRFLNKRGVRIPIDALQLKRLGYTAINFRRDTNPDKISATIFLGELSYEMKLDKYFNLDLEGKFLDSPILAQSIHYVFLSLLRPILCEERIKDPHLSEMGIEEKEVVSRMGHLRWLPEGQRFSKTAVENFFKLEGKDLFVANFQRLEEFDTDRETTYVKPVIEKEENLPPITIHLPGVLQFS